MIDDFLFDGQRLSDFGYMLCSFDSGIKTENSTVSEMAYTEIKASQSNISHTVSTGYDNNLTKTVQIIKKGCGVNDNYELTYDDISEIAKWLCRKDYKWFRWIDNETYETSKDNEVYFKVRIDLQKIEIGGVCIGFELILTANSPYGFTHEFENTLSFTSANTSKDLYVYSDEEGYIYPDVTITLNQAGDLRLTNSIEDRSMYIGGCKSSEVITILGNDIQQVSTSVSTHDLSTTFNYNFFRLCNSYKQDKNTITSNLKCKIVLKYRGIRKVGL